ncbi:MAG: glutamate synthase large subunit [Cyanobacteriota bacterium]
MKSIFGVELNEKSSCGVGFVVNRKNQYSHEIVSDALHALGCVEHRGACASDQLTSDGAGIMTEIPFELLGYERGTVAVASIFITKDMEMQRKLLNIFESTFSFYDMDILSYRTVPVNPAILGEQALKTMPDIIQAIIKRPTYCNTDTSFNKLLYTAIRTTFTKQKKLASTPQFFLPSLSVNTIVYKALTKSDDLEKFYPDLQNPRFKSRFAMFHRRFSTNTVTSWDKAQPFRLIAHNGEINTIDGNRSWAYSREKSMGLPRNEVITHEGISDSGTLNEMAEALMYRSSLPHIEDAIALMIPPSDNKNLFYKFWSRVMEPWDGPALITYSDGEIIGARLDRNGFRPCRWTETEERFYLSSEAGSFNIAEENIIAKGALGAGRCVNVGLNIGDIVFKDPSESRENYNVNFDTRLYKLGYAKPKSKDYDSNKKFLFNYTEEIVNKILIPMINEGKEAIGSMGDTARPAILSDEVRSFFDYFYQNFAQVTNPPLDYLREKMVTELSVYVGSRPNIFAKKELIPPPVGLELSSPILSLGQLEHISNLGKDENSDTGINSETIDITFKRQYGVVDFNSQLDNIAKKTIDAVKDGVSIIILSDRNADWENLPIPVLVILRHIIIALDKAGVRLKVSIIVDSGQIYTTHHMATIVGFGASAVCPYLTLQFARYDSINSVSKLDAEEKEKNLIKAFESGLLKVMSKVGISVVRSYQSSKLYTIVGLDKEFSQIYFRGVPSLIGGLGLNEIVENIIEQGKISEKALTENKLIHNFQFREFNKGTMGEKHSMTAPRSKIVHKMLDNPKNMELYNEYLKSFESDSPINIRHLLDLKKSENPILLSEIVPVSEILKTFGSGAMSFGAISAESQRDIILAMRETDGRSNSGEGGENPYYYTDGITSRIKQIASARFGVTANYLISSDEFQIKVAQGAKPGEGGQLMAIKVNEDIAKARHSMTNVDLISPPPLHDIYSIEDLKELIYELKQLKPDSKVSVKLVSGANIGTISIGVAKAGADIIHISGGDGGTGAATLSSMKHTGLPFEFGLIEVHNALIENNLRDKIVLRTDGGLHTGKDVVMAALMGANEYDFGKLLLIAEGCVMARVCEKNTCPAGIATHDPKFKARYKGNKDKIVTLLNYIAEDVRNHLSLLGFNSLEEIVGRNDLLKVNSKHLDLINKKKLDLSFVIRDSKKFDNSHSPAFFEGINVLNQKIVSDTIIAIENNINVNLEYDITTKDRGIISTLAGKLANRNHINHLNNLDKSNGKKYSPFTSDINIIFRGSAGQGFGVFMVTGINLNLFGEANDSVCKSMSGGKVTILPSLKAKFKSEKNVIIGNCALYGATAGTLYVSGIAGDRFAVRNSGAITVVEGTGLHTCEYMTNGTVIVLGNTGKNLGSGMTGGKIYLFGEAEESVNTEYITKYPIDKDDYLELKEIIEDYYKETNSNIALSIINYWDDLKNRFKKYLPINVVKNLEKVKISLEQDFKD